MTNINEEINTLTEKIAEIGNLENFVNKKVETAKEDIFEELNQRKSKETNVIIQGIKEKKGEDLKKEVNGILEELGMDEQKKDICYTTRIGTQQTGKIRPIKLVFFTTFSAQMR